VSIAQGKHRSEPVATLILLFLDDPREVRAP